MDYYNPATNTERRACPQGRTSCGDAPPLRAPHHDEATQSRPPTTPTPPRSSPPSSSSRQLPPRSACCSFLRAAPAPAPAYDDYDARTTTGAFTASPTPSLLDPPWAWSTEASRRTWATRTRLAAAAAHCLPPNVTSSLLAPEACARPRRRPTAPQQGDRGAAPRLRSAIRRRARREALCELKEPAIDDRIDRERQIATENPAHSGAALPRSPAQRQRLRREC